MHIYTRTGDNGETGIIGGRLHKTSDLFDLVGGLDELNASIGVVVSSLSIKENIIRANDLQSKKPKEVQGIEKDIDTLKGELLDIQSHIFELGTLAVTLSGEIKFKEWQRYTASLEKYIDRYEGELPALTNFILPGGNISSSYLHLSRSICRRTERMGFRYLEEIKNDKGRGKEREKQKKKKNNIVSDEYIEQLESALKFLNRLSDYLFIVARVVNQKSNTPEQVWRT